jgi:carotenoid cleavage dioxygenase-like enzyme
MTNRYLEGEFAPLHQEFTLTDLQVGGTIPGYLDGRSRGICARRNPWSTPRTPEEKW